MIINIFKNHLYTKEIIVFKGHQYRYLESDDGTLLSGKRETKILAQELPVWYVYGRYYKCWGYTSTKCFSDMLYMPEKFSNHYMKDDCRYISYGEKIHEAEPLQNGSL